MFDKIIEAYLLYEINMPNSYESDKQELEKCITYGITRLVAHPVRLMIVETLNLNEKMNNYFKCD